MKLTITATIFKKLVISSFIMINVFSATSLIYAQNSTAPSQVIATLKTGDKAPPLPVEKWLKGKPVTAFKKDRVYVVEFWATWCMPCRWSMPHLSDLAKKYRKEVTVIGVNVLERSTALDKNIDYISKAEAFVKNIGDGMDYTVAIDNKTDTIWKTWALASGRRGIPISYIIDGNGTISWIGHPSGGLDEALGLTLSGKMNDSTSALLAEERLMMKKKAAALKERIAASKETSDRQQTLTLINELITYPMEESMLLSEKYEILYSMAPELAKAYADSAVEKFANNPLALQMLASSILAQQPSASYSPDYPLSVRIMEKAVARSAPFDGQTLSKLAQAYYKNKQFEKAVEVQQKVVTLFQDKAIIQYQPLVDKAVKDLNTYKKDAIGKGIRI